MTSGYKKGTQRFLPLSIYVILPTKDWHLPSVSTRVGSQATTAADLQYPLRGVQG